MKIKKTQIKKLIKEIISTAINETSVEAGWSVNDDIVTIEQLELNNGRLIDVDVEVSGIWDDGAFSYEYGSQKGIHRYDAQFQIEDYNIISVTDNVSQKPIWQFKPGGQNLKSFDNGMWHEIESYWETIQNKVEEYINENPPDNTPELDDERF